MKKYILILLISLTFFSCTKEKKNMIVNVNVKGLQKGTLYLQKVKDTSLIKVDSVIINEASEITLSDNIESPEMYILSIAKTDKNLQFFGEEGTITIKTNLNTFNFKSEIIGSKNQELLIVFKENIKKFNDIRLDLLKEKFDAVKDKKIASQIVEIEKKLKNIDKRKLRYTLNFAFNNKEYEVSPYLTLTELYNLNKKYLDTIANGMSPKIKQSKYGKKLIDYIKEIKEEK